MTPVERIVISLWEIEEKARYDLHRQLPDFKLSEKTIRLRAEFEELGAEFSRRQGRLFDANLRLRNTPGPRWWHYIFGLAFVFERRHRQAVATVQQATNDLDACERRLRTLNSTLQREELLEKERHSNLAQEIAKRKMAAGPLLELVEAANNVVHLQPEIAFCGLDFILSRAQFAVEAAKLEKAKFDLNAENAQPTYKVCKSPNFRTKFTTAIP